MAYAIGTLLKGTGEDTHYQLLALIRHLCEGQGWEILRYNTAPANRELIMKAPGLSGTEEIFLGVRTYQNSSGDYYNLLLGTFIGYVPGNSFDTQPGGRLTGVPAHNNAITYYISVNGQRLVFMLKVGTPVYTHGYIGKMYPYARPSEFPYPVVCAGILNGAQNTRFSETSNYFPYHGLTASPNTNFYLRRPDGVWVQPAMWPFTHGSAEAESCLAGSVSYGCQVPANAQYQIEPIILHDRVSRSSLSNNIWGELDGVYFVSGFNNAVENVVQYGGSSTVDQTGMTPLQAVQAIKAVGGRAFVMGQNINRTSWRDYVAIEM